MEDEMNCNICKQEYSETKYPRVLPCCGHSFCQQCILALLQADNNNSLICPEDKIEMKMENKNIECFPKNEALIELFGIKQDHTNKENLLISSHEEFNESKIYPKEVDHEDQDTKCLINLMDESTKTIQNNKNFSIKSNCFSDFANEDQNCQLHDKPLEVICIQDQKKICATCAIFGEHRGHQFKSLIQVETQIKSRQEKIEEIFHREDQLRQELDGTKSLKQIQIMLLQKKEVLKKQIDDKFNVLKVQIQKVKMSIVQALNNQITGMNKKLKEENKKNNSQSSYNLWKERALIQLKCVKTNRENLQPQLTFLNYNQSKQPDLIKQGEQILNGLLLEKQKFKQTRLSNLEKIELKFNDNIITILRDYCTLKITQKKPEQKKNLSLSKFKVESPLLRQTFRQSELYNQQLLLEEEIPNTKYFKEQITDGYSNKFMKEQLKLGNGNLNQYFDIPIKIQPKLNILSKIELPPQSPLSFNNIGIPKLKIRDQTDSEQIHALSSTVKVSPTKKKAKTSRPGGESGDFHPSTVKEFSNSFVIQKIPVKKKVPKLKLPQKYDKIYQGIITDQLQLVDFTNAELGDQVIIEVLQSVTKRVKTFKLIRNKITDDGILKMIKFFENIITLNLSQNLLTDKSLDIFKENIDKMPNLKSLILSQNRIKQRNVKIRVEEIKKLGITVSL